MNLRASPVILLITQSFSGCKLFLFNIAFCSVTNRQAKITNFYQQPQFVKFVFEEVLFVYGRLLVNDFLSKALCPEKRIIIPQKSTYLIFNLYNECEVMSDLIDKSR